MCASIVFPTLYQLPSISVSKEIGDNENGNARQNAMQSNATVDNRILTEEQHSLQLTNDFFKKQPDQQQNQKYNQKLTSIVQLG